MKITSWRWRGVFAAILALVTGALGLIAPVSRAHAGTIPVSTNSDTVADDGFCSLREAIAAANTDTASGSSAGECPAGSGSDTITVPGFAISLGSQLVISSPLVLVGIGVGGTVIDGNREDRVFLVSAGQVTLRGLTIHGGRSSAGGGIFVMAGMVEISDARIVGNSVPQGGGGGLFVASGATVTVWRTTIERNEGAGAGSGGAGESQIWACCSFMSHLSLAIAQTGPVVSGTAPVPS